MPKTIGIISIKGGVGKTTISAALAADLVNHCGKKVLLVDANYSAPNLGEHMNVSAEKTIHDVLAGRIHIKSAIQNSFGVDVIPGGYFANERLNFLKLKDRIGKIKNNYDFVIIDSSPSLNEEMLSTILASDNLFVVTTPDYPTLICSLRAAKLAKHRGREISGIIINKISQPRFEYDMKEIEEIVGIPVVARLPQDKTGTRALFTRIPMPIYSARSGFAKEINRLNAALVGNKAKVSWLRKLFSSAFRKEEVNREILKESFYKNVFEARE
jgi:septum site-determining protein MinD